MESGVDEIGGGYEAQQTRNREWVWCAVRAPDYAQQHRNMGGYDAQLGAEKRVD